MSEFSTLVNVLKEIDEKGKVHVKLEKNGESYELKVGKVSTYVNGMKDTLYYIAVMGNEILTTPEDIIGIVYNHLRDADRIFILEEISV